MFVTNHRNKSSVDVGGEPFIDPSEIDKHLDAMLDRRNIPENQRYKMRNLNDSIKMEFIRQDWAEMAAAEAAKANEHSRPGTNDGNGSLSGAEEVPSSAAGPSPDVPAGKSGKSKGERSRSRGRSAFTLARSTKTPPSSPGKRSSKAGDMSTLARHLRSKSTDNIAVPGAGDAQHHPSAATSSGPSQPGVAGLAGSGFLARLNKMAQMQQTGPGDFVSYLQRVREPEQVEVGKLHKLRLLLRNETVAWTDEFVRLGGMKEIVDLLHRIMAVEWR